MAPKVVAEAARQQPDRQHRPVADADQRADRRGRLVMAGFDGGEGALAREERLDRPEQQTGADADAEQQEDRRHRQRRGSRVNGRALIAA